MREVSRRCWRWAICRSGGLGEAYGSFFVASLIWCLLTVPIGGLSFIGLFARFLRAPIISGMIVMLMITQIANVALPNWIGSPASAGFPMVNMFSGAIAAAVLIAVTLWGGSRLAPRGDSVRACGGHRLLRGVPSNFFCICGHRAMAGGAALVSIWLWRGGRSGDRISAGA